LDEAERCSRVALVHEGRTLAVDTPARLRSFIEGPMMEVLTRAPDAAAILRQLPDVVDVQIFGERLHVTLAARAGAADSFQAALAGTPLAGAPVRRVPPSLEDVFIARL